MPKRAARKGVKKPAAKRKPSARFSAKPDTATQVAVALAGNSSIPLLAAAGVYAAVRKAQGKPVFPGSPVPAVPDVPDVGGALAGFAAADAERDAERDRQFFNFFSRERDRETRERREREAQEREDDLLVKPPLDSPTTPSAQTPWMPASVPLFQPYVATRGEPIHAQPGAGNRDTWSNVAFDRATPGERPGERPIYRDGRILAPGLGRADASVDYGDDDAPFEWPAEYPGATNPPGTFATASGELFRRSLIVGAKGGAGMALGAIEAIPAAVGTVGEFIGGFAGMHKEGEKFGDILGKVRFPETDDAAFEVGKAIPRNFLRWFT